MTTAYDDDSFDIDSSEQVTEAPCSFLTGSAGCGKTYEINRRISENPNYALLCATTGIAAVNMGENVTTINAALKYFDTDSLMDSFINGRLASRLNKIAKLGYENLVIDEVSMMAAEQLDIIVKALDDLSCYAGLSKPMGLILTGDFCLGVGTKIMMADGSLKTVEDVRVGEQVMGPDSKPRNVLRTTRGIDEMFCVDQTNGESYLVNSKHSLALKRGVDGQRRYITKSDRLSRVTGEKATGKFYPDKSDFFTMPVTEFAGKTQNFRNYFVGYKTGLVNLPTRKVSIEPYFLGLWLGDGDSESQRLTSADSEVIDYCHAYAKQLGMMVTINTWERTNAVRLRINTGRNNKPNFLLSELRRYNLIDNKHIPDDYLLNSEANRLQLLAGLLDSDGSWSGNRYVFTVVLERLAMQVKQLADQLGFRTGIREFANSLDGGTAWTVSIGGDTWRIPCRIARKQSQPRNLGRNRLTSVLKVTPIGQGEYAGFEIDGDHLFLLADGTVTHNCQLPVIKAKWAFEAECWPRFEFNTLRLTKCWRQSNETFQAALSAMRSGNGQYAVELLDACGVRYADNNDLEFSGTSIMSKNDEVDRFNWLCHSKVKGAITRVPSTRWGKLKGEWKLIPENLQLRIGAYVMVLANSKPNFMTEAFDFVNGDCGTVVDHDSTTGAYTVKLKRNDKLVTVTYLTRRNEQKERPSEEIAAAALNPDDKQPYYDSDKHRWVIGEVRYIPLRLAYATTCHKAQGLTLDAVQINLSNAFFGAPAMAYTALSRCREANGLRIVGTKELLSRRVCVEPKVRRFL